MGYSVAVSEPNLGRTITFKAPTANEAVGMARSWLTKPEPTVAELIKASKPPTQGVVAKGFDAFGPMGERTNERK